jgi:hypothetical protein
VKDFNGNLNEKPRNGAEIAGHSMMTTANDLEQQ